MTLESSRTNVQWDHYQRRSYNKTYYCHTTPTLKSPSVMCKEPNSTFCGGSYRLSSMPGEQNFQAAENESGIEQNFVTEIRVLTTEWRL
jgi:hypothetical protein